MNSFRHCLFLMSALASIACASDPKEPPAAPARALIDPPAPAQQAKLQPEQATHLNISEDIRKACGLSRNEAYFAYDSARLRGQDQEVFQKLAVCFTSGPLKGRSLLVLGRADPRGDNEYNLVLGDHRAQSVERVLVSLQVDPDQIRTSSRGEMDALGQDEASWARDRRVDLLLAN